jgi:TPR repeat protein
VPSSTAPQAADEWLAQARRYHRGDGVPSNYTEAIRLYQIAAASGSRPAKRMLELIYSRPAPGGTIDVAWMRQLATMEVSPEGSVLTLQAPPTPQLFVRDPTPLFVLIPQEWRAGRAVGPR